MNKNQQLVVVPKNEIDNCLRMLEGDDFICLDDIKTCMYNSGDKHCLYSGDEHDMAPLRPEKETYWESHSYGCVCDKCMDKFYGRGGW